MSFQTKLDTVINKNNSLVCVGLDSAIEKLPDAIKQKANPQFEFNKAIIDTTHNLVCAYKPNSAFYEALGEQGIAALKMTCDYINAIYPDIPIILDAKRADIGNTNNGYTQFAYDYLKADAITLNPYLGREALEPFLQRGDKGSIILCKTSNPGSGEIQNQIINGEPLYKLIAKKVAAEWNSLNNCLLVVGATYPEELADVRKIVGEMSLLIPGVGAQGGDIERTVKAGLNSKKQGLIISSSRGIIFASCEADFAEKAREETLKLRDEINKYRN
jgi:orotidine-5'-phosphate decarboxylase